MSPLATQTLEAFDKRGVPSLTCQGLSFVADFVVFGGYHQVTNHSPLETLLRAGPAEDGLSLDSWKPTEMDSTQGKRRCGQDQETWPIWGQGA